MPSYSAHFWFFRIEHLLGYREDGADVLGVYPLFPDGTCQFIVFDFDNHEKGAEKTDFANGYICIPRGLRDNLLTVCREAGIEYNLADHRERGRPIRVSFNGDLKTQQDLAASACI